MKRIFSFVIALILILTSFTALAEDDTVVIDGVIFSSDKTILIKYPRDKTDETYEIPESVTIIGDYAFSNCTSLVSVSIPDSVTYLVNGAFSDCTNLKNIRFPSNLEVIGFKCFINCTSLETIIIPETVTGIGSQTFRGCTNLKNITFNDALTTIGDYAFQDCTSLSDISFPNNLSSIGEYSFSGCTNLGNFTLPENLTSIGYYAFSNCSALTDITIPDSANFFSAGIFSNCTNLKSVILPPLTSIGRKTFYNCSSLENITIPDTVIEIYDDAFSGCTSLTSINIPESTTRIARSAFDNCPKLTDIYYAATEIEWNSIKFISGYNPIMSLNVHFTNHSTYNPSNEVRLTLFGVKINFAQPLIIENGRTLVPANTLFNRWNSTVDRYLAVTPNLSEGTYKISHMGKSITLTFDSYEMQVNDTTIGLDVPARIIDGTPYIPIRAVAESFGYIVTWLDDARVVKINAAPID